MESEEENEQRRFGQERKERRRGEGEERIISTREKHKHKNMHRSDAQRGTVETDLSEWNGVFPLRRLRSRDEEKK